MYNTELTEMITWLSEKVLRDSRIFLKSDFDDFISDGIFNQLNYS